MEDSESKSFWSRPRAGQGAIALAVLLAGVGLVVAIRQTQAGPLQRLAELRPEARDLVVRINHEITRQVRATLQDAAVRFAATLPADFPEPPSSPAWMSVVFISDGRLAPKLFRLHGGTEAPSSGYQEFMELMAPRWNVLLHARPAASDVQFFQETLDGQQAAVAALPVPRGDGPLVIAALLDTARLEREVLDPLLAPARHLELTSSAAKTDVWTEPLGPALPFLALRPSAAFVSAEHAAALRQTLVSAGVMLLVLVALLLVMRAMTRVARREMELSRLKSEFVADVSHELKTPLALIQMFGETLREGRVRSEDKKQEYYEIIIRESKRLTHLIDNLLDFARIGSGKKIYQLQRVRVEHIAREVYEAYRHELDHQGFTHELTVADGLPEVEADPDALAQALLNLMSNTVKYSEDDRWLKVALDHETRRGRRGVLISVHDRGIGIRPEDRARVFDGFFRAPDDKVRKRRGAGLGLALVRDIVEAHRGFVEVEARLVKGTTFHIFLPECPQPNKDETDG
jgi:signal transduction histidine kinase